MRLALHTLLPLLVLSIGGTVAADCTVDTAFPDATLADWQQREFSGRTDYEIEQEGGLPVLVATTDGSASVLYRERELDIGDRPVLRWSWSVDGVYEGIEETTRAGDDFPARLYVVVKTGIFPWQTLALNYVWGSQVAPGTAWTSPYTDKAHMIAVRAGGERAGAWVCESRDVVADFRNVFGIDVDTIDGYAVMVDGDNGDRAARARFGSIAFGPR